MLCFCWGMFTIVCVLRLIEWQHPPGVLKWVMGYWLGAYVAIPNYGLIRESSIPNDSRGRRTIVSTLPFATYAVNAAIEILS
jgi:hypothetical protein